MFLRYLVMIVESIYILVKIVGQKHEDCLPQMRSYDEHGEHINKEECRCCLLVVLRI